MSTETVTGGYARVAWRAPTGATGRGKALPFGMAVAWLECARAEHPDLDHWLEFG